MNRLCGLCFQSNQSGQTVQQNMPERRNTQDDPEARVGNVCPRQMRKTIDTLRLYRAKVESEFSQPGRDEFGRMEAHHAAERGDVEAIRRIYQDPAALHVQDRFHMTPLHVAVLNNRVKVVDALLNRVEVSQHEGVDLACLAAKFGYEDVIKLLHRKNADFIKKFNSIGFSAAHEAARNDQVGMLKLLAELGVNFNDSSQWQGKPIDTALRHSCFGAACFLKTPPRNYVAIQVIRGDHKLTIEELESWSKDNEDKNDNMVSGLEDLQMIIQAMYIAWIDNDINGAEERAQDCLSKIFELAAQNIRGNFNADSGRVQQFLMLQGLNSLCKKCGLLTENKSFVINTLITRDIDLSKQDAFVRANFKSVFNKINFMEERYQKRFMSIGNVIRNLHESHQAMQRQQDRMNDAFVKAAKTIRNTQLASTLSDGVKLFCEIAEMAGAPGVGILAGGLAGSVAPALRARLFFNAVKEMQKGNLSDSEHMNDLNKKIGKILPGISGTTLAEVTISEVMKGVADKAADEYISHQLKKLSKELDGAASTSRTQRGI
ncbi:MAG: ankyrin repeat domain-containing protein [Gammaproteobacteria bacterium]